MISYSYVGVLKRSISSRVKTTTYFRDYRKYFLIICDGYSIKMLSFQNVISRPHTYARNQSIIIPVPGISYYGT